MENYGFQLTKRFLRFITSTLLASVLSFSLFSFFMTKGETTYDIVFKYIFAFFLFYFPLYTLILCFVVIFLKYTKFRMINIFFTKVRNFQFFIFIYLLFLSREFDNSNQLFFCFCWGLAFLIGIFLYNFISSDISLDE